MRGIEVHFETLFVEKQMDARLHMENFEQILSLAVKGCKTVGEHLKRAIHNRTLMLANSMNLKTSSSS